MYVHYILYRVFIFFTCISHPMLIRTWRLPHPVVRVTSVSKGRPFSLIIMTRLFCRDRWTMMLQGRLVSYNFITINYCNFCNWLYPIIDEFRRLLLEIFMCDYMRGMDGLISCIYSNGIYQYFISILILLMMVE